MLPDHPSDLGMGQTLRQTPLDHLTVMNRQPRTRHPDLHRT
jgi:hypothetical protein